MTYGFYPGCSYKTEAVFKESVEAVTRAISLNLVTIEDWNCCGATSIFSLDQTEALLLTGRIFALANRQNLDNIVTTCNACYTSLKKGYKTLKNERDLISKINNRLAVENLKITKLLPVRHLLDVLYNDVDETAWSRNRPKNLNKLKVAAYYGCQLTRPWADIDDPEQPVIMERFLERLGYETVDHSAKTLCCGASHFITYEDDCLKLTERIIGEMKRKGAQVACAICPLCQINLDGAQKRLGGVPIPIPYFTQLAGLALGIHPNNLGLKKLLVSMGDELKLIA
jgi:heterodisulfide reductase subunit B